MSTKYEQRVISCVSKAKIIEDAIMRLNLSGSWHVVGFSIYQDTADAIIIMERTIGADDEV